MKTHPVAFWLGVYAGLVLGSWALLAALIAGPLVLAGVLR